jgi:hypothetical protein
MGILHKAMDKTEQLYRRGEDNIGQLTGNDKLENAGTRVSSTDLAPLVVIGSGATALLH